VGNIVFQDPSNSAGERSISISFKRQLYDEFLRESGLLPFLPTWHGGFAKTVLWILSGQRVELEGPVLAGKR
jgi:hypothetical protein